MSDAVERLCGLIENGHLLAVTDAGAALIEAACDEIDRLRAALAAEHAAPAATGHDKKPSAMTPAERLAYINERWGRTLALLADAPPAATGERCPTCEWGRYDCPTCSGTGLAPGGGR